MASEPNRFFERAVPAAVLGAVLLLASPAAAKSTKAIPQSFDDAWSCSLRYIRLDRGFAILERDKEAGYVLFKYVSEDTGKSSNASLEFIEREQKEKKKVVRLQLDISNVPLYVEVHFLDKLAEKLKKEYGE